ncbi:MAG: hypothetical protein ACREI2_11865 [Nitrospiraceae bacterium]
MSLTRAQILASRRDRKPVRLEVPEWGGDVYVRVLSAADQMAISDELPPTEVPIQILLHCLVDESGERIFTDGDQDELAKEDFPIIMRVFSFVAKLNGLSTKELDEAMASFKIAPDEASSSD